MDRRNKFLAWDATSNDTGANWCDGSTAYGDGDMGTPGAANDVCAPAEEPAQ